MAKINLLPWREKDRTQKRAEFFTLMGGAAAITAGLFLLFYIYVNAKIDYQNSRNAYLQEQIVSLDAKIKEIRLLEKKRENLLARMDAIQKLQASRPIIVRLFDEIVTTLPAGVFITSLSQSGSTVVLKGTAQSNARVSNFMRNFELRLRQAAPKNSAEDGESEDAA
jgi:type IV pilus assembly protein PilN